MTEWYGSDIVEPYNFWWITGNGATTVNGVPHLVLNYDDDGCMYYLTYQGGAWSLTMIDDVASHSLLDPHTAQAGYDFSITIDSNGKVHIAYSATEYTGGNRRAWLRYVTNVTGSWVSEEVAHWTVSVTYGTGSTSIAVDSGNNPHIAYSPHTNDITSTALYYSKSGSWSSIAVTGSTYKNWLGLHIDANDIPYVLEGNAALKWFAWNGSGWSSTTITTSISSAKCGFAITPAGVVHVVYAEDSNPTYNLVHRTWSGSSWSGTTTVQVFGEALGEANRIDQGNVSLTVDASSRVIASWDAYYYTTPPWEDFQIAYWAVYNNDAWSIPEQIGNASIWPGSEIYEEFAVVAIGSEPYLIFEEQGTGYALREISHAAPKGYVYVYNVQEV